MQLTRHPSAAVGRKRLSHKTRDRAEALFSCFARRPRADAPGLTIFRRAAAGLVANLADVPSRKPRNGAEWHDDPGLTLRANDMRRAAAGLVANLAAVPSRKPRSGAEWHDDPGLTPCANYIAPRCG